MNISTSSESNSRCESGWTMYWDQLSNSTDHSYTTDFVHNYEADQKGFANVYHEDEDLSMVSDASSGPPQNLNLLSSVSEDKKKNKHKSKTKDTKKVVKKQQQLCLDDTASSPFFHFSHDQDNVATPDNHDSQVFPAANFEGEPIRKKHLGFFKSSTKGKSGRKRQ